MQLITLITTIEPKVKNGEYLNLNANNLRWVYYKIGLKNIPGAYLEVESDSKVTENLILKFTLKNKTPTIKSVF